MKHAFFVCLFGWLVGLLVGFLLLFQRNNTFDHVEQLP